MDTHQYRSHTASREAGIRLRRLFSTGIFLAVCSLPALAQVSVTTWHNDIGRTGQNLNETILNTSDVNTTQFGKLFSQAVDGYVYAQPLYLPNVTIGGQSHNVVFVATENDSVYAFDADNNGGTNASPLWFASMLTSAHGAAAGATTVSSSVVGTDIYPQVGITGTPVIDPTTGTLYVVSATQEGSTFVQRLHALDVTSGAEKLGGPVVINASVLGIGNGSVDGVLQFDPEWENQRPGLLLLNGIVYIGFASHADNGPWHGWVIGYNEQTLQQTGVFCASHNGVGAGMWMAGAGLAAEVVDPVNHPFGRMFVATGNGDYTASSPYTGNMDFGDSILNLDLTNGVPTITDEFTPYFQAQLDQSDTDVASGGVMLVPNQTTGSYPHLLVQTGKSGYQYLLNRENLGGYNTAGDQVVQELAYSVGKNGAWSTPAYWNGTVYYWGVADTLKAFPLVNGQLTGPTGASSETYGYPGATPSISANGNTQGIVWSIESDTTAAYGQAVLQAHDALNPGTTLYSSNTNLTRDNPGLWVKFVVPTVVNGKVYVGTQAQISVYGLLNGQQVAAAPVISPSSESFNGNNGALSVTMSDTTPGATIYYTTNGTTPTTSSAVYGGPISLTASATIEALASASGYLQSAVTTESYVNSSQVATPVISPGGGTYTQPELVTITESTSGSTIYYTTDGSTPTTASTVYTGPITVGTSETVNAIAVSPGFANSLVASATYTLNIGQTGINFTAGFAGTQGSTMIFNGNTDLDDTRLQLTDGGSNEASSAWYYQQVNIQAFTSTFQFQLSNPVADGMTFTIQGENLTALGLPGAGLGYQTIPSSIAVKFDLFSNNGEGPDSTGLYINGASPTVPAIDMSASPINLHSGDEMTAVLSYNGSILTLTITDLVTQGTFSTSWSVNIPAIVGGNTAWVGFTGGSGGSSSSQKVATWTYTVGTNVPPLLLAPTFSPAAGAYNAAQTVTISDTTAGTTIYYTTNGNTPTTSSNVYSAPITVSATETVQAIATESGYTNSPVGSAAYTIGASLPTPTFSVPAGTYTAAQSVSISDSTAGVTIYYTTNGTTPTTSSSVYSTPILVSTPETLQAIAVKAGAISSAVASAYYTINGTGSTAYINDPSGQFTTTGLTLNGGATVTGGLLQVTDGGAAEARAAWATTPVPVQSFVTTFTFQDVNAQADGMTFTIQGQGVGALGASGGGLGYSGITKSIAIKFDIFSNSGEGSDSTGLYINGAVPTLPAINLSSTGVNFLSGDLMQAQLIYDGTNLTVTITDTVTNASVVEVYPVNIPSIVGGNTAYVGFTGGTGGSTATQNVTSWTFFSPAGTYLSAPAFSPAGGAYTAAQSVTLSDGTAGTTIYYTTNGTTPTTSSTVYSGPITVSAAETLEAIAVESGFTTSPVSTAAYAINATVATPTFSVAAGTYSTTQTVSISDTTAGATIYYTTNGTTPTTSSTVYSGPVTVSATETLEAIGIETGYANSSVATAAYTIGAQLPAPTFSPAAGTYSAAQQVTLSDTVAGATIFYTTNGLTPTTSSAVYSGPITVSASETIEAIAAETGSTTSTLAQAVYTIATALPTPTFSPAAGSYSASQSVIISDATAGTTIYYTLNGTTPTTSSTVYSGPITVAASETIEAIAVKTGSANSTAGTAAYIIASTLAAPTISPAGGTYTTTQSVTLSAASGATIYYTLNGTAPTTGSTVYSGPISVGASETIEAIAAETGFNTSSVSTAQYTINLGSTSYINFSAGVFTASSFDLNGGATVTSGGALQVSDGGSSESRSGWFNTKVPVGTFINDFTFQQLNASGDGMTFAIQGQGATALGAAGGGLGYQGIAKSVAVKFDLYSNAGEGPDSTGVYTNGASPTVPATDMTSSGLNLHSGDVMHAHMVYDGTNLTLTLTDTVTNAVFTQAFPVNIPSIIGSSSAFVGFTAGTGGASATQNILTWTYVSPALPTAATPTFSPASGAYPVSQSVTISDTTTGATIYYTTNGTTPTTASNVYSGPVSVGATETLEAIAVLTGDVNSTVASAAYTIGATVATPTFSPAAGPYATAQTVTIGEATSGATVYYTTNGTAPTTSSAVYTAPIAVSSSETVQAVALESGYINSATASAAYTIGATAATPTFSPAAGAYTASQTVTISDTTPGATIYYTTNGTAPTTSSAVYSAPITVAATENVQAIAVLTGYVNSATASSAYTIGATVATPTFSVAAGAYTTTQTVTIGETTTGATIYYTTNGTTPTTGSAVYSGAISVSASETLEAIAVESGYVTSATATAAYIIGATAATPTFSPVAGAYTTSQSVTISSTTAGATIYYTTNGTTPTTSSAVYSAPITVGSSETVEAIAVKTGYFTSTAATAAYVIGATLPAPTFSPAAGPYTAAQMVTLSDANAGATIYYTTNGGTPTTSSTVYSGPITVSATETVKAIAVETGYTTSVVASGAYTIGATIPTPSFTPAAGTYTSSQSVAISDSLAGTTIYYTTNGTAPTTGSAVYSGPISVGSTETLEALAVATGYNNSAIGTAAYTINLPAAAPTFSVPAGTYSATQTVTISDTAAGATIYYTTNGTTPTTSSTVYSGAITVSATETLSAIATATGYSTSPVASAAYTINNTTPAAAPTFSVAAGTYNSAQTVTMKDTTAGAVIYYALNGTTPTKSSTKYLGPVTVGNSETLNAIAIATGYTNSPVTSATYALVASTPVITPVTGSYPAPLTVTITSASPAAKIFYTTNGMTPNSNSTVYNGPITVTTSETVTAIAIATGYTSSSVVSATYSVQPVVAAPVLSVAAGSYTSAQTVTISEATGAATVYYTTNGTTPTTSSAVYGGPITVSSSETLEAIGIATGYYNSPVAIAAYTISPASASFINIPSGQFSAASFDLNGGATVTSAGLLQVTDGGSGENRSAWYGTKLPVTAFTTDFTFQQLNPSGDGMTFAIQNQGTTADGAAGGGLGYQGIGTSVAVKFDIFSNSGEGTDSTGVYTNGAVPTLPAVDMTSSGLLLLSGDLMHAHIVYDGTNLTLTLTDTVTNAVFTQAFPVNIPSIVGGSTAWVGFTGGTGGDTVTQNITSWTYIVP